MRKLASIRIVTEITPIEGKDRIVLAAVDGWHVIVKKDEFKEGDKCVYVEIDSVLPEKEEFEFLRKNNFRIKTMKLGGVVSQGICFPLNILPQRHFGAYEVGEDVTKTLEIKQYERTTDKDPTEASRRKKYPKFLLKMKWFRRAVRLGSGRGDFPSFIRKTDETRIQNIPAILKNKEKWVATEKIDGQSGTFCLVRRKAFLPFMKDRFEYMVCSRNRRLLKKDNSSYWSVSERYGVENILRKLIGNSEWVAIQGECIAPGVQGNKYKTEIPDLYVFNLVYPTGRLDSVSAREILSAHGMKFVPILSTEYILPDTVDEVLEYAHGKSALGDTLREGIVFRSENGVQSFKAVDPQFLMKYDE